MGDAIMTQGSLFNRQAPRAPPPPRSPAPRPRFRTPLEKHDVADPWGRADAKGNLFWQKMHKELEKLPVETREFFNHITIVSRPEVLDGLEKCLRLFNKANDFDRLEFDEGRGR